MNGFVSGILAAIYVGCLAVLVAVLAFDLAVGSIVSDCNNFGSFTAGGKQYVCAEDSPND